MKLILVKDGHDFGIDTMLLYSRWQQREIRIILQSYEIQIHLQYHKTKCNAECKIQEP